MEQKYLSRITVENNESHEKKVVWEIPYNDATLEDWIHGFVTCMVGLTFSQKNILEGLRDYANEWLADDITENDNSYYTSEVII